MAMGHPCLLEALVRWGSAGQLEGQPWEIGTDPRPPQLSQMDDGCVQKTAPSSEEGVLGGPEECKCPAHGAWEPRRVGGGHWWGEEGAQEMPPAPGLLGASKFSSRAGVRNGEVVTTAVPVPPQSRPPRSESRPFSVPGQSAGFPALGHSGVALSLSGLRPPWGWAASSPRPEREQPPFTLTRLGTESLQHPAWVSYLGSNKSP